MARTWEWRIRSWAGTRSQRGLAEARLTLAAGVEAGARNYFPAGLLGLGHHFPARGCGQWWQCLGLELRPRCDKGGPGQGGKGWRRAEGPSEGGGGVGAGQQQQQGGWNGTSHRSSAADLCPACAAGGARGAGASRTLRWQAHWLDQTPHRLRHSHISDIKFHLVFFLLPS